MIDGTSWEHDRAHELSEEFSGATGAADDYDHAGSLALGSLGAADRIDTEAIGVPDERGRDANRDNDLPAPEHHAGSSVHNSQAKEPETSPPTSGGIDTPIDLPPPGGPPTPSESSDEGDDFTSLTNELSGIDETPPVVEISYNNKHTHALAASTTYPRPEVVASARQAVSDGVPDSWHELLISESATPPNSRVYIDDYDSPTLWAAVTTPPSPELARRPEESIELAVKARAVVESEDMQYITEDAGYLSLTAHEPVFVAQRLDTGETTTVYEAQDNGREPAGLHTSELLGYARELVMADRVATELGIALEVNGIAANPTVYDIGIVGESTGQRLVVTSLELSTFDLPEATLATNETLHFQRGEWRADADPDLAAAGLVFVAPGSVVAGRYGTSDDLLTMAVVDNDCQAVTFYNVFTGEVAVAGIDPRATAEQNHDLLSAALQSAAAFTERGTICMLVGRNAPLGGQVQSPDAAPLPAWKEDATAYLLRQGVTRCHNLPGRADYVGMRGGVVTVFEGGDAEPTYRYIPPRPLAEQP